MQRVKGIELDLIHPMSNQPSNLISTPTRDSICILPVLRMHAFLCWQMLFYYGQIIQIRQKIRQKNSSNPSKKLSKISICILPVLRMHAFLCWQMLFYYGQNIQIVSKNYHSMARLNLDKSEELVTNTTTA